MFHSRSRSTSPPRFSYSFFLLSLSPTLKFFPQTGNRRGWNKSFDKLKFKEGKVLYRALCSRRRGKWKVAVYRSFGVLLVLTASSVPPLGAKGAMGQGKKAVNRRS